MCRSYAGSGGAFWYVAFAHFHGRRRICDGAHPKAVGVAQRVIEMLIGRLITDEQFRTEFLDNPRQTLERLSEYGFELSQTEITALLGTDSALWERAADALDPRLQKASLKNGPGHSRP